MPSPSVEHVGLDGPLSISKASGTSSMADYAVDALTPQIRNTQELIEEQFNDTRERQRLIGELRDLTQKLRAKMGQDVDLSKDAELKKLVELCKEMGVTFPAGNKWSKKDVEVAIENIKTTTDTLNSTNEMDMLRMQRMLGVVNHLIQLLSSLTKKEEDTKHTIISKVG